MTGLQQNVYVAVSITWPAALSALILRVIARRLTNLLLWYDDYFCISAFVFASGYNIIMLLWTTDWGLGQFVDKSLSKKRQDDMLSHSRLFIYCGQLCHTFSIASATFATLCLNWRLFKHSSIRIPIVIMSILSVIWLIIGTFMMAFSCIPIKAYWDKSIKDATCAINDAQLRFSIILTHSIIYLIIMILPIMEISRLRLRIDAMLPVMSLFLFSSSVCLASIFMIVESIHYNTQTAQLSHDITLTYLWGSVELNIAIVSACLPFLRPIFRRILPRLFLNSYKKRHSLSRPINSTKFNTVKGKHTDESSSAHQLADPELAIPHTPEAVASTNTPTMPSSHINCG